MMKTGAKAYIFIFKYYGLVGHISDAKYQHSTGQYLGIRRSISLEVRFEFSQQTSLSCSEKG